MWTWRWRLAEMILAVWRALFPTAFILNYLILGSWITCFRKFFQHRGFFHGFNFITNSFVVWAWLSLIFQILIGIQWNIDSESNINPVRIPDILEKRVYLCFLERIINDRGWENWRHFTAPLSFLNYVQTWTPHKLINRDFKFSQPHDYIDYRLFCIKNSRTSNQPEFSSENLAAIQ